MNDKAKEAKKAYMKEWSKKNRDKLKAAQERYWENKAKANEESNECQSVNQ